MPAMMEIIDVQSRAELDRLLPEWLAGPAVALDTEFFRERSYFPVAGLIQLSIGGPVYLIDPIAIGDLDPLGQLFQAPLVKVLHSASEDLEVFQRVLGAGAGSLPGPLADTQVGAALAGYRFGLGYQGLVEALLGEQLDKGETRSDWLRRPLTASQRHYAAMDVAWLLPAYWKLRDQLETQGRLDWWREESARTLLAAATPLRPEDSWQRLKGAGRLSPTALAILQEICAWRERVARGSDLPRGHVIKDAACLELARRAPATVAALRGCEGLSPRQVDQYGSALLEAVAQGGARSAGECPATPRMLTRAEGALVQRLRALVEQQGAALGLAPELLARRRELEALVRDRRLPAALQGWRRAAIGDQLLAALDEQEDETR